MAEWKKDNEYNSINIEKKSAIQPKLNIKETELNRNKQDLTKKEIETNIVKNIYISKFADNLSNSLMMVEDEVLKGYLVAAKDLNIIPISDDDINFYNQFPAHFFKITEIVHEENEFSLDKIAMLYSVISNSKCTVILMIKNHKINDSSCFVTEFYLGVRSNVKESSTATLLNQLSNSLKGFFPGTKTEPFYDDQLKQTKIELKKANCVSCITTIADVEMHQKIQNNDSFFQGLEKFVNSMKSIEYTGLFIADSLDYSDLLNRRKELETIYNQLSPFENVQYNFSLSESEGTNTNHAQNISKALTNTDTQAKTKSSTQGDTLSNAIQESTINSKTISNANSLNATVQSSVAKTTTNTDATATAHSDQESTANTSTNAVNAGFSIGGLSAGASHSNASTKTRGSTDTVSRTSSIANGISKTLSNGLTKGNTLTYAEAVQKISGTTKSMAHTTSNTEANTESSSISHTDSYSLMDSIGESQTFGNSKGITLNAKNLSLTNILRRIEKQIKRIDECESYGMWNFAAYFLGKSAAEASVAATTYKAIISGPDSGIERSSVTTWIDKNKLEILLPYIENFRHPCFEYKRFAYNNNGYELATVSLTSLISSKELAIHMGFPKNSVPGLPVTVHASFAQEVISSEDKQNGDYIKLGHIYHMGEENQTEVKLKTESLPMHTFITGATGSGKSNAVYHILDEISNKGFSFLVIEPSIKGEYKKIFGNTANVFGINTKKSELLRLNPFWFPEGIDLLEHLDRLISIFNVCWPMYAAMPAVLKEAIERSYKDIGWDLLSTENKYEKLYGKLYPSFSDVERNIKSIIDASEYDNENKGAYKGSLLTRVHSLSNGINGLVFSNNDIPDTELFDKNVIIDLSGAGSDETKSLIMGILILKLQEYRITQNTSYNRNQVKHITVLEEAHNLLRRTNSNISNESSNLVGKSVEMISNSIAEMRAYGEGFVIVDQAPGLLDMAAIRNTNTKIILRLPDYSDRELVGKAANLNNLQINELAKLPKGVAAVYQNEWEESLLCKITESKRKESDYHYQPSNKLRLTNRIKLSSVLCNDNISKENYRFTFEGITDYQKLKIFEYIKKYPQKNNWKELSPIISSLWPELSSKVKELFTLHNDIDFIKNQLKDYTLSLLDNRNLAESLIQCIVTNYAYYECSNPKLLDIFVGRSLNGN